MTDLNPTLMTAVFIAGRGQNRLGKAKTINRWLSKLSEDQELLFWVLHIGGWGFYYILRVLNAILLRFLDPTAAAGPLLHEIYIFTALTAMLLTLIMRYAFKAVWPLGAQWIFALAATFTLIMSAATSSLELWAAAYFYPSQFSEAGLKLLGNVFIYAPLIMAWAGLYLSIKFLRMNREQNERMLKITAMAHQAQLKMLRYQLNPHFLFNTLNAISTLLLDKNSQAANRMLTKMSSFLRYTLVNQPNQKVTLDQELHALGLYLDIEKVRFEDRLSVEINADKEARNAHLPSLILQPLIENAIKYAIAPSEDGGALTIHADVREGRLHITLCDTGPGLPDHIPHTPGANSSGVGLANTKERLAQIYKQDFLFELYPNEPKGLCIHMAVPAHPED